MDPKQFEVTLADVETRLKRLRVLYDQWFMGIERIEPQNQRLDLERMIARLRAEHVRNTALKFRFNQLLQRFTTYSTYWKRVTRQIEEGTYRRDVVRAQRMRRDGMGDEVARGRDAYELDVDVDIDAALDATMDSQPPARASSRPPASEPGRTSGMSREITPFALPHNRPASAPAPADPVRSFAPPVPSPPPPAPLPRRPRLKQVAAARATETAVTDAQIASLYDRYLEARRNNRERTDNVKFESLAKSVREMMPKLAQKHAGKRIDFEVVVHNGKVALKPVAK